jgi:hypothetical protein
MARPTQLPDGSIAGKRFLSLGSLGLGVLATWIPKRRSLECHRCGWKGSVWLRSRVW